MRPDCFGKGLYKVPHAIRLDPEGNVWTVDAGSSTVIKFSPKGTKLLEIDAGGLPGPTLTAFCGTTDVAFAPKGWIFISDGYAKARILEYTADGKKVREWGSAGAGPGQFHLPHSIVVDENNNREAKTFIGARLRSIEQKKCGGKDTA